MDMNCTEIRDNQGRNMAAVKRNFERLDREAKLGRSNADEIFKSKVQHIPLPSWMTINGVDVLCVSGQDVVAVPSSGKKTARRFDVIDLKKNAFLCQLKKDEVCPWLWRAAVEKIERKPNCVTNSLAFRQWFGDSKVVDANGEPLMVYHGTVSDFATFDKTRDVGFHFGPSVVANKRLEAVRGDLARREGKKKKDTVAGNVIPVYLSIDNPLEVMDAGDWTVEQFGPQLVELGVISQGQLEQIVATAEKLSEKAGMQFDQRFMIQRQYGLDQMRLAVERAGYGGLKYANKYETRKSLSASSPKAVSWIALYPEQIKSATGNQGTFDPSDPDITK